MDVGSKFDVAIPICAAALFDGKESRLDHRSWWWLSVAGRTKPGVSLSQLAARLRVLSPQVFTAALPQNWAPDGQKNFLQQVLGNDSGRHRDFLPAASSLTGHCNCSWPWSDWCC